MADTGARFGLFAGAPEGENWTASGRAFFRLIDGLLGLSVIDKDLATPPGSPTDGQNYIVAATPTGAWVGHTGHIARYSSVAVAWEFVVPPTGLQAYVIDEGLAYRWSGSAWVGLPAAGGADFVYTTRASNTVLGVGDKGKVILASAGFTQTLTAAATLGAGWWCLLGNETADGLAASILLLDPDASELVDGLATLTMYSGELRLLMCTGTAFRTKLLQGGYARFTASGSFVAPPGIASVVVDLTGAGGGGGGGRGAAAATLRLGGTGGGGGGRVRSEFPASLLGAAGTAVTVTLGAGGTSGSGGANASGSAGGAGGNTTFGALVTAYGGGGGRGGDGTGGSGGAGGGNGEAGQSGQTSADTRGGGNAVAGQAGSGGAGSGSTYAGTVLGGGEWGGGHGGRANNNAAAAGSLGAGSLYGGAGAGAGSGVATTNVEAAGGIGGLAGAWPAGGGAAAGAVNGGAGSAGADGDVRVSGGGGAGGGGQDSGTAGAGGNGGAPAGGGGGGGGGTTTGGAGGVGGRGECRVWYR